MITLFIDSNGVLKRQNPKVCPVTEQEGGIAGEQQNTVKKAK